MTASPDDEAGSVSTLELFFDLVFVFTITQLTTTVADDPTPSGVARAMLIFGNLWWMYGGYAWLTNAVPPRRDYQRLLLLFGMAGFLVAALGIPDAFGDGGIPLGVGYVIVTLVHDGMLLRPMQGSFLRGMGRLGPANFGTAVLVLVAGLADGWLQWTLWVAAFVLHWVTPFVTKPGLISLRSGHFVERHGLILLIALGESVVVIGLGVETSGIAAGLIVTAVLALVVVAALWWLVFDADDVGAERALAEADGPRRSWLALHVYGYAFLVVLGGVIVFGAGMRRAMVEYDRPVSTATAALIAGGVCAYLLGLAAMRWRMRLGSPWVRVVLAALSLPTLLIGAYVSPLAQLAVLGTALVAGNVAERRARPTAGSR